MRIKSGRQAAPTRPNILFILSDQHNAKLLGHRGIEIEPQGKRLVLDIGQPLDSPDAESVERSRVKGLKTSEESLLGVVLSHPHIDHYGLAFRVPTSTRVLMGTATERILETQYSRHTGGTFENVTHL